MDWTDEVIGVGEAGTTGDVTVVGTLIGAEDGGVVVITLVVGYVVTEVMVRVWVNVTGLVTTEEADEMVT